MKQCRECGAQRDLIQCTACHDWHCRPHDVKHARTPGVVNPYTDRVWLEHHGLSA